MAPPRFATSHATRKPILVDRGATIRILYFGQHFSTPLGATGTRPYEMARRLVEEGHEVTMICGSHSLAETGVTGAFLRGRREGVTDGIRIIELDLAYSNKHSFLRRSLVFVNFALRSAWTAVTEPADVVFATTTPLTAAIPGMAAKWLRWRPFVFEVRDLWPDLPRAMGVITNPFVLGAMSLLEWSAYRSADRLIALSPGIREGIARHGIRSERLTMIPNGCDLEFFGHPSEPWRPEGVGPTDFMAIFTGTHGAANGLGAVIDAAAELKRRGSEGVKLVLVGDGKEKPGLSARVKAEGLESIVVFHPAVSKVRLTGLMASADLGLQILANVPAFYYGTSPNKFFDYLAAGLPVLTNYPGWVADLVSENGAGFAVPPDDPSAFADALEQARDLHASGQLDGRAARALGAAQFDRERLAGEWTSFVVGAARTARPRTAG
jgi:glycosyltransferase involved in cell wall biosynthesis